MFSDMCAFKLEAAIMNVQILFLKRITKNGGVIQVAECSFNIPIRFVQNELLNMCAVVVLESLF